MVNKTRMAKLIHRIENIQEDLAQSEYKNMKGCMCIIGHMAVVAGVELPVENNNMGICHNGLAKFKSQIDEYYGFYEGSDILQKIQTVNDSAKDAQERKANVLEYLIEFTELCQ